MKKVAGQSWVDRITAFCFGGPNRGSRVDVFAVVLIGVLGAALWLSFYVTGFKGDLFSPVDWNVKRQYLHVVSECFRSHHWPYWVSVPLQPMQPTRRFLAIPEALHPFSPQAWLLAFLKPSIFVTVDGLLHYLIGFLGCLRLRRKLEMPLVGFLVFVMLFNFNGNIVCHTAVGHNWNGYFYLPWFASFLFEAATRRGAVFKSVAGLSIALLLMLLQGSFHLFLLSLFALALLALCSRAVRSAALGALAVTVPLSLFRILPAALTFGPVDPHDYEPGFDSLSTLYNTVVLGQWVTFSEFVWEYDLYIGVGGFVLLLLLLFWPSRARRDGAEVSLMRGFCLAIGVMVILSFGHILKNTVSFLPTWLHNPERVPPRFMAMALFLVIVLAAVRSSAIRPVAQRHPGVGAILVGLAVLMSIQLAMNVRQWRMSVMEREFSRLENLHNVLPHIVPLQPTGGTYVFAVRMGECISVATLGIVLAALVWRLHREHAVGVCQAGAPS